ncbi:unnamed protein product [Chironomus riparius]|uniref:Uncharacterized protein n=1 Tax=Chironomus riparius TaxID=315576 RepID=A0A9N9RKI8_9DIPT|nr:unnamed protein product [Chironomus riparius]
MPHLNIYLNLLKLHADIRVLRCVQHFSTKTFMHRIFVILKVWILLIIDSKN